MRLIIFSIGTVVIRKLKINNNNESKMPRSTAGYDYIIILTCNGFIYV